MKFRSILLTAFTSGIGLIVLLGYFFESPLFRSIRLVFLHWTSIILAFGVVIVVVVMLRKSIFSVINKSENWILGLVSSSSLVLTVFALSVWGINSAVSSWLYRYAYLPLAGSLIALVPIILLVFAIRMLTQKPNGFTYLFLATFLLLIIGITTSTEGGIPFITDIRNWVIRFLTAPGARGLLIGISIGVLIIGLRTLLFEDRHYGETNE